MAKNSNLHAAKAAKNDEFYTQLSDIEKELAHYKAHFKGKIVFCNCDDPTWSNFWRYFHLNFEFLGLKKLIATHYDPVAPTYKLEYTGGADTDLEAGVRTDLRENGDFRSPECVALLDECDIVVTNPPFSLFREYVALLMKHGKKFVIIGSNNVITYKEIFPLLKDDKMWLGNLSWSAELYFRMPEWYEKYLLENKREGSAYKVFDGVMYARAACMWYTNLDHAKRHEPLVLYRTYNTIDYVQYDNYDAINVNKTADIPCDYAGVMGVPISFLAQYCPEQFEILGVTDRNGEYGFRTKIYGPDEFKNYNDLNRGPVVRVGNTYKVVYTRIFVRRK